MKTIAIAVLLSILFGCSTNCKNISNFDKNNFLNDTTKKSKAGGKVFIVKH